MFTQKKKEYYSKILGFKTIQDFEEFSKRYLREPLKIPFKAPNFYFFWFLKNLSPILTELY